MRALYLLASVALVAGCSSSPSPGVDEFIAACDVMHDLEALEGHWDDMLEVQEVRDALDELRAAPTAEDEDMALDIDILLDTADDTMLMPAFRDGVMRQSCIESFPRRYGG